MPVFEAAEHALDNVALLVDFWIALMVHLAIALVGYDRLVPRSLSHSRKSVDLVARYIIGGMIAKQQKVPDR